MDLRGGLARISDMKTTFASSLLALVILLLSGCGDSTSTAEKSHTGASGPPGNAIGDGSGALTCKTYTFIGQGPDDWRRDSYWFGPFGMSHNLGAGNRDDDGLFRAKAPMVVEGHRSVVLSVPKAERDRVALEIVNGDGPLSTLSLKPCADRRRTLWAGGLVLRDLRPVRLNVRTGARKGTVVIGPPETERG